MINLNTGFSPKTNRPIDPRIILSKSEMKTVSDGIVDGSIKSYPDNFFCICKDDATTYAFNKTYKDTAVGRYKQTPKKKSIPGKYGMRIDATNGTVTYLNECADFTPLTYDSTSNSFSLGSWKEDEFFMPRPCLLGFDGTVKYYIDPNDYTKTTTGDSVNVKTMPSDGNFMVEWGRNDNQIWYSVEPDDDNPANCTVYFNPTKIDDTYHAWSFLDHNGNLKPHFYTSMFVGVSNSRKLRSYYLARNTNKSYLDSLTMAAANNVNDDTGWNLEAFCDRMLINYLLILITKHIDPVSVIGLPTATGSSPSCSVVKNGLFAKVPQSNTATAKIECIRVFGIDAYYGTFQHYVNGLFNRQRYYYYKMCEGRSDGSTTDYYNTTGEGYTKIDILLPSTSINYGDHIKTMTNFSDGILLPTEMGANPLYIENMYTDSRYEPNIALFGGYSWNDSSLKTSGPFCVGAHDSIESAWNYCLQGRLTYR